MKLPYPLSPTIRVFADDGRWPEDRYFLRPLHEIEQLYQCTYRLRTDLDDDPDITLDEWKQLSEQIQTNHPACVFIYT